MRQNRSLRRPPLLAGLAVTAVLFMAPTAQAQLPQDAVERLQQHWKDSKRFAYNLGDALEKLKGGKPEGFWSDYAWAKVAVDTGEALLKGDYSGAGQGLIEGVSGIGFGRMYPTIGNYLGWWQAAKQALEILDEEVVTPARMETAIDGYIRNREAGLGIDDSLTTLHDWGQVEYSMRKLVVARHGKEAALSVTPSSITLTPEWEKKLDRFTSTWFELQYTRKRVNAETRAARERLSKLDNWLVQWGHGGGVPPATSEARDRLEKQIRDKYDRGLFARLGAWELKQGFPKKNPGKKADAAINFDKPGKENAYTQRVSYGLTSASIHVQHYRGGKLSHDWVFSFSASLAPPKRLLPGDVITVQVTGAAGGALKKHYVGQGFRIDAVGFSSEVVSRPPGADPRTGVNVGHYRDSDSGTFRFTVRENASELSLTVVLSGVMSVGRWEWERMR